MNRRAYLRRLTAGALAVPVGAGVVTAASTAQSGDDRAVAWSHEFDEIDFVEQQDADDSPTFGVPLAADGDLVAIGGQQPSLPDEDGPQGLVSLDAGTGVVRWTRPDLDGAGRAALGEDVVVLLDEAGTLRALDRDTGESQWSISFPDQRVQFAAAPAVLDDAVVAGVGRHVVAAADGAVRWKHVTADRVSGLAVEPSGVFVTAGTTALALDAATGEQQWQVEIDLGDERAELFAPVVLGDRVVALGTDGTAYGLVDGDVAWTHAIADRTVAPGRSGVVRADGRAVAIRTTRESPPRGRPEALPTDRLHVAALEPADGTVAWRTALPGPGFVGTERNPRGLFDSRRPYVAPTATDDVVYVPGRDVIVALDAASGERQGHWARSGDPWSEWFVGVLAVGRGLLLAETGRLVALVPSDCRSPTIDELSANHGAPRPGPWQLEATVDISVEGDCGSLSSADLYHDGTRLASRGQVIDEYGPHRSIRVEHLIQDFPEDERVVAEVRGTDGTVADRRDTTVDYRGEAGDVVDIERGQTSNDPTPLWPAAILAGLGGGVLARAWRSREERGDE